MEAGKHWCSWCNDWALMEQPPQKLESEHHPSEADPSYESSKWREILNGLSIGEAKPEHDNSDKLDLSYYKRTKMWKGGQRYSPQSRGKLSLPHYSVKTYSDLALLTARLSEQEKNHYNTINVYSTYVVVYLNLPGSCSEKFYRVGTSIWQHEVDYESD